MKTMKKARSTRYRSETKAEYFIGIDPGVKTGVAIWSKYGKCFLAIETIQIHRAMECVKNYPGNKMIRLEDARQRKWFGNAGREQLQGAGSIKRDCKIWEDFLTENEIPFELVAPKNNKTKLNAESFKQLTRYEGKTSEHARDAAMLVFGL